VPGGWGPAPPDFVGVGVQRAGTSWWYALLEDHPRVQPLASAPKEVHFFERYWRDEFSDDDVARYHSLFLHPPGKLCGEWTPRYMFDPWTAPLLHRAAPDARLLVMLRDPVERFTSGLTHSLERGRPLDEGTVNEALARGLYHAQLTGLLRHFPRPQVLVLQYERCAREPTEMLRRTFEFLGLADVPAGPSTGRASNRATIPKLVPPPALMAEVHARLQPDVARLVEDFPEISPDLWPNFRA
jgi:hypothetical protein